MTHDQETPVPRRRKGADHFGYGIQVALGKNKDGEGLWHSHGKHYHKPDTYWCGSWGDRTPEELLLECESTLADLHRYHPELFIPHTAHAIIEPASGFIRTSFLTLHERQLFPASRVADLIEQHRIEAAQQERERVLKGILMAMNDPQLNICDTGYLEHSYWRDYINSLRCTKGP
jgi:hypothetical protein